MGRSKYGNQKTVVNGIVFASKREAARYSALKIMQDNGTIQNLRVQVPFELEVNGSVVCRYVADFVYEYKGETHVEDVKGMRTPVYKLKKKLLQVLYGIEVQEI